MAVCIFSVLGCNVCVGGRCCLLAVLRLLMMMMTNKTMESKRLMAFVCKMNECGYVSCFHLQRHLLRLPETSSQEAVLLRELKCLGEG